MNAIGRTAKTRAIRVVAAIGLGLIAAASLTQGIRNAVVRPSGSQDFQWDAARVLLTGENPYRATLEGRPVETDRQMPDRLAANQLPSALVLLWPYAALPWSAAKVAWAASNLLFTAMLVIFAFRALEIRVGPWGYVMFAAALVASTPWRNLVGNGQHLLFSLAFFCWAIAAARNGRHASAGVLLAVALFKYTTVVFLLPYFIYKRWYRPLAVGFAIHAALHLAVAAYLRESPVTLFLQSGKVSMALHGQGYLDVAAVLGRLGVQSATAPLVLALLLAGVTTWLSARSPAGNDLLVLSVLAFVSTVAVYHRSYDFVVLLFPLLYAARRRSSVFSLLCIACIVLTWYATRLLELVAFRSADDPGAALYLGALSALWYATIAAGLLALWRTGSRENPAAVNLSRSRP